MSFNVELFSLLDLHVYVHAFGLEAGLKFDKLVFESFGFSQVKGIENIGIPLWYEE